MFRCVSAAVLVLLILADGLLICYSSNALQDNDFQQLLNVLNNTSPLEKTSFKDTNRLIFVAGLEGTGHHGVREVFNTCVKKNLCQVDSSVTDKIMRYDFKTDILHGLFGAADVNLNAEQAANIVRSMRNTAHKSGSNLFFLGLCFVTWSAMLSYPNHNGLFKPMDHPDMHMLAALAETAGLDFRVIVLQRDAEKILRSNSKRGHGGALGPKVMIANAEAMAAELSLLDNRFFMCVQYEKLGRLSDKGKSQFADFLHPVNMLKGNIIEAMLSKFKYSGNTDRISTRKLLRSTGSNSTMTDDVGGADHSSHDQSTRLLLEAAKDSGDSPNQLISDEKSQRFKRSSKFRSKRRNGEYLRAEKLNSTDSSAGASNNGDRGDIVMSGGMIYQAHVRNSGGRKSAELTKGWIAEAKDDATAEANLRYHIAQLQKRLDLIDAQCSRNPTLE